MFDQRPPRESVRVLTTYRSIVPPQRGAHCNDTASRVHIHIYASEQCQINVQEVSNFYTPTYYLAYILTWFQPRVHVAFKGPAPSDMALSVGAASSQVMTSGATAALWVGKLILINSMYLLAFCRGGWEEGPLEKPNKLGKKTKVEMESLSNTR